MLEYGLGGSRKKLMNFGTIAWIWPELLKIIVFLIAANFTKLPLENVALGAQRRKMHTNLRFGVVFHGGFAHCSCSTLLFGVNSKQNYAPVCSEAKSMHGWSNWVWFLWWICALRKIVLGPVQMTEARCAPANSWTPRQAGRRKQRSSRHIEDSMQSNMPCRICARHAEASSMSVPSKASAAIRCMLPIPPPRPGFTA